MDLGEEEQRMEGRLVVAGTVVEWTQGDKEVVIRSDSPAMSSVTFLGRHPKVRYSLCRVCTYLGAKSAQYKLHQIHKQSQESQGGQ